jgi:hypothetical protein
MGARTGKPPPSRKRLWFRGAGILYTSPQARMKTSHERLFAAGLSLAVAAGIVALATSRSFYLDSTANVFFACTLAAAAILHFSVAPWKDIFPVAGCVALLAVIDFGVLRFPESGIIGPAVSLFGMSSVLVFAMRTIWTPREGRGTYLSALVGAVLFVASDYAAMYLHRITEWLHPRTLDLYLNNFDAALGIQLSFVAGALFVAHPLLNFISAIFYIALPVPLALDFGGLLRKRSPRALPAMLAFLLAGPVGWLFYNLFPACGPRHIFAGAFPLEAMTMAQAQRVLLEPIAIKGLRNAIPSLHMAWVLLAWWNSRGLSRWVRGVALLFVGFTVLATLGTGEHYFVDLVAAFPFAVMVQALADFNLPWRARERWLPFAACLGIQLAWLAALGLAPRMWWLSPAVGWLLSAATIASAVWLEKMNSSAEIQGAVA